MGLTSWGKHRSAKSVSRRRRAIRIRKKISGTAARPRLVVTRSTRHMFVQIVDDTKGVTLASDRKSTRLNSSHIPLSRMPSSA